MLNWSIGYQDIIVYQKTYKLQLFVFSASVFLYESQRLHSFHLTLLLLRLKPTAMQTLCSKLSGAIKKYINLNSI